MSFLIGDYEFEGPLVNWTRINNSAAIYAVMSYSNQEYELVELNESPDMQATVLDPARVRNWQNRSNGMLTLSVHYCPRLGSNKRREIVNEIMREFDGHLVPFQAQRGLVCSGSR